MAMIKPTLFALETLNLKKLGSSRNANTGSPYLSRSFKQVVSNSYSLHKSSSPSLDFSVDARKLVEDFNPRIPLQEALTPPSSWYTDPSFLALEFDRVFYRGWQVVGFTEQIKDSHDFFTGRLGNVQYLICRDDNGKIHGFHNVCRHHASLLASGSGKKSCFICPYHGWTYGLDGLLLKATRISGIQNFNVNDFGLVPLKVATWGPFVLVNLKKDIHCQQEVDSKMVGNEWLGSCSEILSTSGIDLSLSYVCRREYMIECNWKVFCDNYLDGGYHVPYAHTGLASGLKLDSYSTTIFENVSIQSCQSCSMERESDFDRLGSKALYAFIYPNFMINRMTMLLLSKVYRKAKECRWKILNCVKVFKGASNLQHTALVGMLPHWRRLCIISIAFYMKTS